MTSLLPLAVHFLVLTQWLTQEVSGWAQLPNSCEHQLGMAEDAFDDQYEGCTEQMEKKAPKMLKEELRVNKNLNKEWEKAKTKWEKIKNKIDFSKKINDFHGIALVTYTGDIATAFNKAVREFRQNQKNFQFKAFHYYLTRALQLLSTGECYTVYRGCKNKFDYSGTGNVRFGQFTSSSLSIDVAKKFAGNKGTLFTIKTCLGVKIEVISRYPYEREVLIPGYEVYQQVIKNDSYISLDSPKKFKSNFNCFYKSTNDPGIEDSNFNSLGMRESPAFILLLPGLLVLLLLPAEL